MGVLGNLFDRKPRGSTPAPAPDESKEKRRKVLVNQFCQEVYSMAADQQYGFATTLHLCLGSDTFRADRNTREMQKMMEETVSISPTIQSGDQFRGLAKSDSHERFTIHFRAMMLLQALTSIRQQLEAAEYSSFQDDCVAKYNDDYVYTTHIHTAKGGGWLKTPATGVLEQYLDLYLKRGDYKPPYRIAHTFLDLYFFPNLYQADLLPPGILDQITWEFEGYIKWADSLVNSAASAVRQMYG